MKCWNHNDRDAVYKCVSCKKLFCNECVKSFKVGGLTTHFCSVCNSQCKEIETSSEVSSQSDSLVSHIESPEKNLESPTVKRNKVNDKENSNQLSSSSVDSLDSNISNGMQSGKGGIVINSPEDKPENGDIKKSTSMMLKKTEPAPLSIDKTGKLFKPVKIIVGVDGNITNQGKKKEDSVTEVVKKLQKELAETNVPKPALEEHKTVEIPKESVERLPSEQIEESEKAVKSEHMGKFTIPNSISVFFRILFNPEKSFKDSILYFNTSSKFRISFFITTSLFLFFSAYLKSLHSVFLVSFLEVFFLNLIVTLIFTGFLSRLGKVSSLLNFASFVFGISVFIYLLQIISISYFDPRFQGIIISGISVVFLLFRAFVFIFGVNKVFEVGLVRVLLFFMISFSSANLSVFIVSRVLFQT